MNVKTIVSSIIVCILILLGGQVYAAPEATVTIESEDKAKSGDEISVNLKMNVSSAGEGVEGIIAEMEYPKEILTMLTPESSEVTIMDGMLMVALDEPVKQGEKTITIKFIVKNDITEKEATIKFADVILTDADKTTKEIGTIEKKIKINEEETPGGETPGGEEPGGEEPGGEEPPAGTEVKLESIEITNKPNKTEYKVGEKFDKTGMTIMAEYSDGRSEDIENYTYSPAGKLGKDDKEIIISYTEEGVTKTAKIEITVKEEEGQEEKPGAEKPQGDKDGTVADKDIPDTGIETIVIPAIIIAIMGIVGYIGYRKNNI